MWQIQRGCESSYSPEKEAALSYVTRRRLMARLARGVLRRPGRHPAFPGFLARKAEGQVVWQIDLAQMPEQPLGGDGHQGVRSVHQTVCRVAIGRARGQ